MGEYRNSLRSKRLIRQAFAELIHEKGDIRKISVKELVNRADISKSTFYGHYQDIYAVSEEFENEIIELINSTLDEYLSIHSDEFMPYISKIIDILKINEKDYRMMFNVAARLSFIDKLKKIVIDKMGKDKKLKLLSNDLNHRITEIDFLTNGIIYLFVDYYCGSIPLSLDEIGDLINSMFMKLAQGC